MALLKGNKISLPCSTSYVKQLTHYISFVYFVLYLVLHRTVSWPRAAARRPMKTAGSYCSQPEVVWHIIPVKRHIVIFFSLWLLYGLNKCNNVLITAAVWNKLAVAVKLFKLVRKFEKFGDAWV